MSYDLSITVDHGDGYKTTVFDANTTYNLRPMIVAAGLPDSLHGLHGKTAAESQDLIYEVWRELRTKPEYYSTFDDPGAWGQHRNLLPWMKHLYIACRTHPRGVIEVS